jgi:hypothetical protein
MYGGQQSRNDAMEQYWRDKEAGVYDRQAAANMYQQGLASQSHNTNSQILAGISAQNAGNEWKPYEMFSSGMMGGVNAAARGGR